MAAKEIQGPHQGKENLPHGLNHPEQYVARFSSQPDYFLVYNSTQIIAEIKDACFFANSFAALKCFQ